MTFLEKIKEYSEKCDKNCQYFAHYKIETISKLIGLLEEAVEMADFYSEMVHHCLRDDKTVRNTINFGEAAQEFLKKMEKLNEL